MNTVKSKQILDKSLELESGSQLLVECKSSTGRKFLFSDLNHLREQSDRYESIIMTENKNSIILEKQGFESISIRKPGGILEEVKF